MTSRRCGINGLALALALWGWHAGARPASAQVITWNWSVTGSGFSGSGTFTTNGTAPLANTTYTVLPTGITGTIQGSAITGLGTAGGADQTFRWDGTGSSPFLVDVSGVMFKTATNQYNFFYNVASVYAAMNRVAIFDSGGSPISSFVPSSSSVTPLVASVPEPSALVLGGVAAAAVGLASLSRNWRAGRRGNG